MLSDIDRMIRELSGGDRVARTRAVDDLVRTGSAAVPQLLVVARDGRWLTRLHAMLALARLGEPRVIPFIREALSDRDDQVRQLGAEAAGAIRDKGAVPQLCNCLAMRDEGQRRKVARALARIGRAAVPALIDTAAEGTETARLEAARLLGELRDPAAIPVLRAALQERGELQSVALDALIALEDQEAAPILLHIHADGRFTDSIPRLIYALGALRHPAAVPLLLDALAGRRMEIGAVHAEIEAICSIGSKAVPMLVEQLNHPTRAAAAGAALWALQTTATAGAAHCALQTTAAPALETERERGDSLIAQRASAVLAAMGRAQIDWMPQLAAALQDPLPYFRSLSALGLKLLAQKSPHLRLRVAVEPLRAGTGWFQPTVQRLLFQSALDAINAATASLAGVPLPAASPDVPSALPVPASPASLDADVLPRAPRYQGERSDR